MAIRRTNIVLITPKQKNYKGSFIMDVEFQLFRYTAGSYFPAVKSTIFSASDPSNVRTVIKLLDKQCKHKLPSNGH